MPIETVEGTLLSTAEAAGYCGLTLPNFNYHRSKGHIEAFTRYGKTPFYLQSDLDKFKQVRKSAGRPVGWRKLKPETL